ncbi:uncharacterized protein UHO2_06892 [Ustilago hordei]|uniref:uncharacterized protein n=1 Tax=Ustilago hordei TaxID=120017 RepID=UPI001A5ABA25|nr:uncharacterized protein UHO2_06892 [Ustilago hordei]SYW83696.1 uncharacterized protein UHO2_06892 [Ustilago hordei]
MSAQSNLDCSHQCHPSATSSTLAGAESTQPATSPTSPLSSSTPSGSNATTSASSLPRQTSTQPTQISATCRHQASTCGSRFNKTDHIAYFNWSPSDINNLIDIIYNNDHYQRVLLPGCLTAEQEKGLKTNKDVICGQIWQELFPDKSTVGGAGQVKTKIRWLTEQYNNIKKTISQQTSAGVLLQDMDHNSSDYATCKSIAQSHPWFEHWHEMMTNCAQTGPVVLLTGHPYDATPASSQNNLVDADVNMDDASDAHYPQQCNIPGMESILEELQNDPIGARVISSFSSSVAATPAAASSLSHSPFSSSSNLSLIGPTPFTITPIDTPTHQHSSSTAFEADEVDNGDGDSVYHSPATGTTPKKSRPFTSKSKREELSEIVQACTQDMLQAQIKVEEECTKREEMHIQFAREESERQECM